MPQRVCAARCPAGRWQRPGDAGQDSGLLRQSQGLLTRPQRFLALREWTHTLQKWGPRKISGQDGVPHCPKDGTSPPRRAAVTRPPHSPQPQEPRCGEKKGWPSRGRLPWHFNKVQSAMNGRWNAVPSWICLKASVT